MYDKQECPARPEACRDVAAAAHDATHVPERRRFPRREHRRPSRRGKRKRKGTPPLSRFAKIPPSYPSLISPPWERLCPPHTLSPHPSFFFVFFFSGCLMLSNSPKSLSGLGRRHSWPTVAKSKIVTSCTSAQQKSLCEAHRTCRCPAPPRVSHPGSGLRRSNLCLAPPTCKKDYK